MAAMLISAQAVDYDGAVLSGAKLNVYDAGTTTPRAIYASKDLASGASSANPAVATATGGIAVWVDDSAGDIKVTLTNSAGTSTYYSQDNIDPTNGNLVVFPLGGSDQTTGTGDSVAFAGLTLSGNLDMQGNRIVLDADNDSYIEVNSDDSVSIFIGGTEVIKLDASASDVFTLDGVSFSPTGAVVGQALGYPSSTTTVEPYTPAGGGDTLAAADETISGDWTFSAGLNTTGRKVYDLAAYATIAAALTAISSNAAELFIGSSYTLTANTNIPANVTLRFGPAGKIVLSTFNLNLNGCNIIAGRRQIFDNSGGGTLGPTSTGDGTGARPEEFYPEWFGAAGDGSTDDHAAFELAFSIMDPGSILALRPSTTYHCDSKIDVTSRRALTITTGAGRSIDGTEAALIELDASSADDCLFNFSDVSSIRFDAVSLSGSGAGVSGSYLIKATDPNGDLDIVIESCTLAGAETILYTEGRNVKIMDSDLASFNKVHEIDWPASYTPGANTDQTAENGFRGFHYVGNRIHGGNGGIMVTNTGSNAHNMRGFLFSGNYIDTSTRLFYGYAREFLFQGNVNTSNNATSGALISISDVNAVGGLPNRDIKIADNVFAGMKDTATPANDRNFLTPMNVQDAVGVQITNNVGYYFSRDGIVLSDVTDYLVSGFVCHDGVLDHVNSEPNGTLRAPVKLDGTCARGRIENISVIQSGSTPSSIVAVRTTGATVSALTIGSVTYDATKWARSDYAEVDTFANDVTIGNDLTVDGSIALSQGERLNLDDDGDSYIRAPSDDDIRIGVSSSDVVYVTPTGLGVNGTPSAPGDFGGSGSIAARFWRAATSGVSQQYSLWNSNSTLTQYGLLSLIASSSTAGSESGYYSFQTKQSGTTAQRVNIGLGLYSHGATGGDPGSGLCNMENGYEVAGTQVVSSQQTTGVAEAAFVENGGGTAVNVDSTFGGYTLQQIAQALQNHGLLA